MTIIVPDPLPEILIETDEVNMVISQGVQGPTGPVGPIGFMVLITDPGNGGFSLDALNLGPSSAVVRIPAPFTNHKIVSVAASVTVASNSGSIQISIRNLTSSAHVLSTPITIDVSELDSTTAAVPPVILTDAVSPGDQISFDVDLTGTNAKGLIVEMVLSQR